MHNPYITPPPTKQLGLWTPQIITSPTEAILDTFEAVSDESSMTLDEIREALPDLLKSIPIFYDGVSGQIPANGVIKAMAKHQTRTGKRAFKSTERVRSDADIIALNGRIFMARLLGESPERLFNRWKSALKKGNGGVFWEAPPDRIGLRTSTTSSGVFILPNRKTNHRASIAPNSMAFVQINNQHDGDTLCDFKGWSQLYRMLTHVREKEGRRTVSTQTLHTQGALNTLASLKKMLEGWV